MRYFIIAGEVSGHTYAEQLMRALSQTDPLAEFNYRGPDKTWLLPVLWKQLLTRFVSVKL